MTQISVFPLKTVNGLGQYPTYLLRSQPVAATPSSNALREEPWHGVLRLATSNLAQPFHEAGQISYLFECDCIY